MSYTTSPEAFKAAFALGADGKGLTHFSGRRFKAFPFNTTQQSTSPAVESLRSLTGYYLGLIEGVVPKEESMDALIDRIAEDVDIEPGRDALFRETVRQLFFEKGQLRSLNLKLQECVPCVEPAERRVAEYLADVLGDRDLLREQVRRAMDRLASRSNVLEGLVLSKLEFEESAAPDGPGYDRITTALKDVFEQDFTYTLASEVRTRDYLLPLLEFYFFSYTAQACLQLDRLLDGDPDSNRPIYFCLEWEKTSQSRLCFTDGWKLLEHALSRIFAHVITLEILNQTEGEERFDYVKLARLAGRSGEEDERVAEQVRQLTALYRDAIDCAPMREHTRPSLPQGKTASEVRFLFDSVRIQFEASDRRRRYSSYAEKFDRFCKRNFLKFRGRSGFMLSLSEETLIFLTKMCVNDQEALRLKDVFSEFERRGVFLDTISKEHVTRFFEKLNLIEKKSDSGDAKYVKRIL